MKINRNLNIIKNEYIKNVVNKTSIAFLILAFIYASLVSKQFIISGQETVTFWSYLYNSFSNYGLFTIFLIVNATKVISTEYESGTIAQIAITPIKRSNIILYKFIYILSFSLLLMLIHVLIYSLVGVVKFGNTIFDYDGLLYIKNHVETVNFVNLTILSAFSMFIDSIIFSSLAFMLAILFRKPIAPIIMTFVIWISGAVFNVVSNGTIIKKLLFTSNIHIVNCITGNGTVSGNGFFISLSILLVYVLAFLIIAQIKFCNTDIRNNMN